MENIELYVSEMDIFVYEKRMIAGVRCSGNIKGVPIEFITGRGKYLFKDDIWIKL